MHMLCLFFVLVSASELGLDFREYCGHDPVILGAVVQLESLQKMVQLGSFQSVVQLKSLGSMGLLDAVMESMSELNFVPQKCVMSDNKEMGCVVLCQDKSLA